MSAPNFSTFIHDGIIICPCCHETIEVKRRVGEGATYVHKWKQIPDKLMKVIRTWLYTVELRHARMTKVQLRHRMINYGVDMTESSCSARVSELLGLGVITYHAGEKQSPHYTTTPPKYSLNHEKAVQVLDARGVLKR